MQVEAHRFAQPASDAVALHRAAQRATHGEPYARPASSIPRQRENCHMDDKVPLPLAVNAIEIRVLQQS